MKHLHWMRYVSLLLCAVLVMCSFAACGKGNTTAETEPFISEAVSEITDAEPASEPVADEESTAAPAEETTGEAATEAPAETPTEKAEETQAEETEPAKKAPETKEEIVALFNDSVNGVKSGAKAVVSNYTLNTQTSDAALSNKMLQNIANKLISANMGYDSKKANVTYSGASAIRDNFPVRGQNWSSKLSASDVSRATCTEKDGVYIVTLYLNPDTTPNIKNGEGHAGKAFSIITKDQIVEGAGSLGMSVIQEDSIKLTFKDARITAKIDAETGKLKDINYYIDWTLALTALGIDVAVSFGAEDDYGVKW